MYETIGMVVPPTMNLEKAINTVLLYNNEYEEWDYIDEASAHLVKKKSGFDVGGLLMASDGYCQYEEKEIYRLLDSIDSNEKVLLFDVHF